MAQERLRRQMEFLLEVNKLKEVFRQSLVSEGGRRENDAEHSWHVAVAAALLAEHAAGPVDATRVLKMLLLHDVVEIDAGDVTVYDTAPRGPGGQGARGRRQDLCPAAGGSGEGLAGDLG